MLWANCGRFLFLFRLFEKNIRSRLVRVLNLYRGFIVIKIEILTQKRCVTPPAPLVFSKVFKKKLLSFLWIQNFGYELLGSGEVFEGDFKDTCRNIFSLMLIGGRAEGLACADPGSRTPISVKGNLYLVITQLFYLSETFL